MKLYQKFIGHVESVNLFLVIKDSPPPFLIFSDALDSDAPILMFNAQSLKKLVKLLHVASANIIKLERDAEREKKEKKKKKS